jgi:acetyl-CoA synthetase
MPERLERYHFYDREWSTYDELLDWFEWEIPDEFNVTAYCLDRWARETPDSVAVHAASEDGRREAYTYEQLSDLVARLATVLADRGVGRGDRVGVCVTQRIELVASHLAAWRLGAVTVPLSTRFQRDALAYRLGDCEVTTAVVHTDRLPEFEHAAAEAPALRSILAVGEADDDTRTDDGTLAVERFWDAVDAAERTEETVTTASDDDAMVIYTSGTTGDPKGVRHTHSLLLGHLPSVVTAFYNLEPRDQEVFYTPVEWAWVGPLWAGVLPSLFYGKGVLAYEGGPFDPEVAMELVDEFAPTRLLGPTTVWRMLQQVEDPESYDLDSVEVIVTAGESMGESVTAWLDDTFGGTAVHEGYGQTEAMDLVMDCSALFPPRPDKMGRPTPGVDVRVVAADAAETGDFNPLPAGEVGEIAVRYGDGHPLCFEEYWRKPEQTAGKVVDGWLLTEDLGVADDDGYLAFEGRKDDVILCSGYRIGPEEVEESVATHPAVAAAGVIGVPDEDHGEVPKAFVLLSEGHEPSDELAEELKAHVKDRLAMYEYPRKVAFVDDLPRTGSGKIQRSELEAREGLR